MGEESKIAGDSTKGKFAKYALPENMREKSQRINELVNPCLPFNRKEGKFYTPPSGTFSDTITTWFDLVESCSLQELLAEGNLWECNVEAAQEVLLNDSSQRFCPRNQKQIEVVKENARKWGWTYRTAEEQVADSVKKYCQSCKQIKREEDLTPIEVVVTEDYDACSTSIRNYPYLPEYILIPKSGE